MLDSFIIYYLLSADVEHSSPAGSLGERAAPNGDGAKGASRIDSSALDSLCMGSSVYPGGCTLLSWLMSPAWLGQHERRALS